MTKKDVKGLIAIFAVIAFMIIGSAVMNIYLERDEARHIAEIGAEYEEPDIYSSIEQTGENEAYKR